MKLTGIAALGIALWGGLCLVTGSARAQEWARPWTPPRPSSLCSVSVEDGSGRSLPTYYAGGRTYILGEQGTQYIVRVSNRSGERVEAVVSVDGRDVINGQRGDYVRNRGYVIAPYGAVDIRGFRQSLDAVATFRFSAPRHSYSARMGTPENVGVIGVACFSESPPPVVVYPPAPPPPPYWEHGTRHETRRSPAKTAPESRDAAPSEERARGRGGYAPAPGSTYNLGTEYGESRYSPVSTTSFVRLSPSQPQQLVMVHYDDAEGLEARGIQVYWFPDPAPVYVPPPPEAFPDSRFAPPPP